MTRVRLWAAAAFAVASMAIPGLVRADSDGPGMMGSDRRLAAQLPAVDRAIDILQAAHTDYHGDRNHAIDALNQAVADLRSALKEDNENEPTPYPVPYQAPEGLGGSTNGSQAQSDEMLVDARTIIERATDQLQGDAHDYGGYRVKAIADLGRAKDDLNDALASSDRNIVATAGLLDHASDVLNGAKEDYGGHRVLAIQAIDRARSDLRAAFKADNISEGSTSGRIASDWENPGGNPNMGQYMSNERLRDARAMVAAAMDQLQHDSHDYNGYRAKAVAECQTAVNQIDQALSTVR